MKARAHRSPQRFAPSVTGLRAYLDRRLAQGSQRSDRKVDVFLTAVVALAEPVKTHFLWRPQLRDAGDEIVLEAAVNGRADALVTFNVRDFGTVPPQSGIEVLLPRSD